MALQNKKVNIAKETLVHFSCAVCKKWWTVGDAPKGKKEWFCPWCGVRHRGMKKAPPLRS